MSSSRTIAIAFSHRSVSLILIVLTAASVLATWFVIGISRTQDQKSLVQTSHFVGVTLNERQKWLNRTVVDYADWGTAYTHLHLTVDDDWAYERNNLGRSLQDDLGIEYVAVFDPSGKEVYTVVEGALTRDPVASGLQGGVKELISRAAAMDPAGHQVASGILMVNGEPILASASILGVGKDTSVTRDDRSPSVLLLGDRLTKKELADIRGALHVGDLHFHVVEPAKVPENEIFLRTNDGSGGFALDIEAPRPGRDMLHAVLPWLGVIWLSLACFVILLTRHGLRVAAMSQNAAETLAESHRILEHQALHDPVTGLPNRAMFARHLQTTLASSTSQITVLFLDLDRFKPVNDTFGHEAGDFVLREVGRRLRTCTRQDDLAARIGGDEFVVVVSDQTDAALHRLCRRIIHAVSSAMTYNDEAIRVGVSIGIAHAVPGKDAVEDVLRRADHALYAAKEGGRSRYRWYENPQPAPAQSTAA